MTTPSQNKPKPAPGSNSNEPLGVPGGSYDVDEAFIKERGAGQALKEGEKQSPQR